MDSSINGQIGGQTDWD